jgi:hypothetical protein
LIETPEEVHQNIIVASPVVGSGIRISPQDSLLLRAFEHENPGPWLINQAPRVADNYSRYESAVQEFFSSRAEIDDQIDDFRSRREVYVSLGVVESIAG